MSGFEIKVTVGCPDLVPAATILANAMTGCSKTPAPAAPAAPIASVAPAVPVVPASPTPTGNASNSMNPGFPFNAVAAPSAPAAPVAAAAPAASAPMAAMPAVPLAQAPTFTLEQVSKAGADLVTANPGKMPELMALLAQYGVQTVNALRPEQLGAFATQLRGMGAKI